MKLVIDTEDGRTLEFISQQPISLESLVCNIKSKSKTNGLTASLGNLRLGNFRGNSRVSMMTNAVN